ncbi:MAG: NADH-quinone oxidoreductase subunit C [Candidatus Micrarchaeota archaeon]|nr:NADH-quinone oxidoreductase subunit C [Candidatus Micrarchaeota archaeon]
MKVEREKFSETVDKMRKEGFDYLVKITAVDYGDHLEAVYMLRSIAGNKDETLEVQMPEDDAWMPTIIHLYKAADWYEREMHEMFGISIKGRRMDRLLLEKWDGIDPPFRKTFVWDTPYRTDEGKK